MGSVECADFDVWVCYIDYYTLLCWLVFGRLVRVLCL